jgi:predicted Zn-dependent protease
MLPVMIKHFLYLLLPAIGVYIISGCSRNAATGRSQLSLVSESEVRSMASGEYQQFLNENPPVPASDPNAQMVKKIGGRIASAIEAYYKEQGKGALLEGYQWEFNLVTNKEANAWCMPGGKVVVYSGILPLTFNENGLAVVMGHEIAHAIARHGNERLSQQLLQQMGGVALQVAVANKPAETQGLFMGAYGVGTTVGATLPFSRAQESEADRYGLIYAAMAGYDPQEAIAFWTRMSQAGGNKPAEFLSTHPSDQRRISDIKKHMPEALKYYKKQ